MDTEKTIIHVRFAADGTVVEIGERPDNISPQQWFDCLSNKAGRHYRALAGGRGAFSLSRNEIDSLSAAPAGQ